MEIPAKRKKTSNINIRIDPELKALLDSKAAQQNQPLTRFVLWALLQSEAFTDDERDRFLGSI